MLRTPADNMRSKGSSAVSRSSAHLPELGPHEDLAYKADV